MIFESEVDCLMQLAFVKSTGSAVAKFVGVEHMRAYLLECQNYVLAILDEPFQTKI